MVIMHCVSNDRYDITNRLNVKRCERFMFLLEKKMRNSLRLVFIKAKNEPFFFFNHKLLYE